MTFDIDYATAACIKALGYDRGQDAAQEAALYSWRHPDKHPAICVWFAVRRAWSNAKRDARRKPLDTDVAAATPQAWLTDFQATLEDRQATVARLMSEGRTIREIADIMQIGQRTVDRDIILIREKLIEWRETVA